jgi:hypothetical protein
MQRGATAYYREDKTPLKLCSEPFDFNGRMAVIATRMTKNKANRSQGMYAIEALLKTPPAGRK